MGLILSDRPSLHHTLPNNLPLPHRAEIPFLRAKLLVSPATSRSPRKRESWRPHNPLCSQLSVHAFWRRNASLALPAARGGAWTGSPGQYPLPLAPIVRGISFFCSELGEVCPLSSEQTAHSGGCGALRGPSPSPTMSAPASAPPRLCPLLLHEEYPPGFPHGKCP